MSEEKSKPNSISSSGEGLSGTTFLPSQGSGKDAYPPPSPDPTSEITLEKDVKAPNVFERVKEEFEAVLHGERHHKETHGLRKDIDVNTPTSDVKAPNVFERAKEEIEALVQAIHPKKEDHSHASTSDDNNRTSGRTAELKTHDPDSLSDNKTKMPTNHNVRVEESTGTHLPGPKSQRHHKETHGRSDDIDDKTPISEVKGPNIFERAKEEIEALFHSIHRKK